MAVACLLACATFVQAEQDPGPVIPPAPAATAPTSADQRQDVSSTEVLEQGGSSPQPVADVPSTYPIGTAARPHFWIVSGRCAPQGKVDLHRDGGLAVYERTADGRLHASNCQILGNAIQPGVPVCVFIHGSFVDWQNFMAETLPTYCWLRNARPGQPLHVIFYTWPSEGPYTYIAPVDICVRGRHSAYNAFHISQMLSWLPPASPVCLLGHSHGARAISATLHLLGGGSVQGQRLCRYPASRRYRAVFAAAAIDHDWLNASGRYARSTCVAEGILNLRNREDLALRFYPLSRPFSRHALAIRGLTSRDQGRLCCPGRVQELDVTGLVGKWHNWPFYFRQPSIARSIAPYVYFD